MSCVVLKAEGGELKLPRDVAFKSSLVKNLVEDTDAEEIPIPNVTAEVLQKTFELCDSSDFYDDMSNERVLEVILACNYLEMEALLDSLCKEMARRLKGKSLDELRAILG